MAVPKIIIVDTLDGDTLCLVDGLEMRILDDDVRATRAVWDELDARGITEIEILAAYQDLH